MKFSLIKYKVKYYKCKWLDEFWLWFSWFVPARMVYWCMIRAGAHGTTKKYSTQVVPEMTFLDALKRWEKDHKLYK